MIEQICPRCSYAAVAGDVFCEDCGLELPFAPAAHASESVGRVAVVSDVGRRRQTNEDSFALVEVGDALVVVVCDGVSTTRDAARAATLASRTAALTIVEGLTAESAVTVERVASLITGAVAAAQRKVAALDYEGAPGRTVGGAPSSTLVMAVVLKDAAVIGNVGDSRAYWISDADAQHLITADDVEGAPGVTADDAEGTPQELSRLITRWIGSDADRLPPRISVLPLNEPGWLVLCTDGLWRYLDDAAALAQAVRRTAATTTTEPNGIADDLVRIALENGGSDNVTVAVARLHPAVEREVGA